MSISCLICNRKFKNKHSLAAHKSNFHRDVTRVEIPSGNVECQVDTDQKDELQTEEPSTYSSACPFRMNDLSVSSSSNVHRPYISKKRKHNDVFSDDKTSSFQQITPKPQPLNLLTSYGIRNLLVKKMENDSRLEKLTENQQYLVEDVLSLRSMGEVAKILNENIGMVLEIITDTNMDV